MGLATHTVYPKKYAHGFVVLCFVVVMQSFIMNSHEVFIHIHQGYFAGTGAIVRLPQCQWSKPDGYGKISQCTTTTKHNKAKTVCIFLGIYCMLRTRLKTSSSHLWDLLSRPSVSSLTVQQLGFNHFYSLWLALGTNFLNNSSLLKRMSSFTTSSCITSLQEATLPTPLGCLGPESGLCGKYGIHDSMSITWLQVDWKVADA